MKKTIIFDYYNTLYNPLSDGLFDGAIELLKKLNCQYKLILITTTTKTRLSELQSYGLDNVFSEIIVCPIKVTSVFEGVCTDPINTIVVGDRMEEEIRIGKKLGCKTIQVNPVKENPVYTIAKLTPKP